MEIIGRVTANALVKQLPDNRAVIQFSVAINERYKSKGLAEVKKVTTYVDCSYWLTANIAPYLKKGNLVELSGRVSASAWKDLNGEPKARLNFHVNTIKLHGGGNDTKVQQEPFEESQPADDLPF